MLWLSTWMIHNANHLRPSRDGLKVGGHQASCASLATLMTGALLRRAAAPGPGRGQAPRQPDLPRDPVPAGAAGRGEARAVPRVRRGAVVPVADQGQRRRRLLDGLGRAGGGDHPVRLAGPGLSPAQATGARRRARRPDDRPGRRCRARRGQRLRGPPGRLEARRPQRLVDHRLQPPEPRQRRRGPALPAGSTATFRSMGWDVVTLKYGRRLQAAFERPGGEALRDWIDNCPNSLYSALVYRGGAGWRARLKRDLGTTRGIPALLDEHDDAGAARPDDEPRRARHGVGPRGLPRRRRPTRRPASSPTRSRASASPSPATRTTTRA